MLFTYMPQLLHWWRWRHKENSAEHNMHCSIAAAVASDEDDDTEDENKASEEDSTDGVDVAAVSDNAPAPHCRKSVNVGERGTKRSAPPVLVERRRRKWREKD